ncbi:MAG: cell division protein SepF [Candidatus Pacearchaeota archaeon]|jgi:SepF-like predicted cell division protein (DUF552 family)
MAFKKLRNALSGSKSSSPGEDYLEIDLENQEKKSAKILVRLFMLREYEDTTKILNYLREGYTIAVINIQNLKKKDPIELKRAISKIKKTAEALNGSIAGFGEVIIVTPSFATIPREIEQPKEEKKKSDFDDY